MIHNRLTKFAASACLALSACWGCVEREEVITVGRDGSVIIELEYEGTEEQLARGDAMPSADSGWDVVRSVKKDNDEVKHVLSSTRRFEPRERLPRTFASKDDPHAGLYLDFPTTVRVEQRRDGLYFYFRRAYTSRPWAYVQHWNDLCVDDDVKKLEDKPVEKLTIQQRGRVVKAFACSEAFKQLEFAKAAIAESNVDLPVEHRLIARQAVLEVYEEERDDFEELIERCVSLPEDKRGLCYDEQAERILAGGYAAFVQSLSDDAGLDAGRIARFERAYERARRRYEITDALGGHVFEIDVRMPGTIIAHNTVDNEVEEEDGMSTVRFQFEGNAFRDRTHELIVVSRLESEPGARWRTRINGDNR